MLSIISFKSTEVVLYLLLMVRIALWNSGLWTLNLYFPSQRLEIPRIPGMLLDLVESRIRFSLQISS